MNVLITGGTSGIGKELAIYYARNGHNVVVVGRNQIVLDELKLLNIFSVKADLTCLNELNLAYSKINQFIQCIDLLILNAGACEYINLPSFSHIPFQEVMNINFFGVVNSLEYFLPLLKKSKKPHLVGVVSMAYYIPFSRAEAYGASKAAVNYLFESLAVDLLAENIFVTVVNPGFVDTPLTKRNDFFMPFLVSVEKATQIIVNGIKSGKVEICFPKKLTIPIKLISLLPRAWQRIIAKNFTRKSSN